MTSFPCKVCGGLSRAVGVVPFSRTVGSACAVKPLNDTLDTHIQYERCEDCGFLFTRDFDGWTDTMFREHVYNDDYRLVDPECEDVRPAANARFVAGMAGQPPRGSLAGIRVLDYGSWNGSLELHLRQDYGATDVDSHDGLVAPNLPNRLYDVVTCFEVLEHLTRPEVAVAEIRDRLQLAGRAFVSTLLQPEPYPDLDWWYVGPRNGHVSIHSRRSIKVLFDRFDMNVRSMSGVMHTVTRRS